MKKKWLRSFRTCRAIAVTLPGNLNPQDCLDMMQMHYDNPTLESFTDDELLFQIRTFIDASKTACSTAAIDAAITKWRNR